MRLLVVDDDPAIAGVLKRSLEFLHHDVTVETEAARAAALPGPFDAVLSDYLMPVMDGLELLELVSLQWPSARRVLLTAVPEDTEAQKALVGGLVHVLVAKPPTLYDIEKALR